jgi:Domain of unknown function (DUF4347)/FG-GAP-like repeat/Calx-beta domain/RTX calcium-binding nonapeptide repeat (4 copies)/FG-GAP repeat
MNMLVVIDSRVQAYPMLAAGVRNGAKVIVIDPNFDGIEQITRSLADHPASSLHIVCHGEPGTLYLGKTPLNGANLETYRHQLQQWHVTDILLYACNVAALEQRSRRETNNPSAISATNLLYRLQQLTGANIAASAQRVGNPKLGGTWYLENHLGNLTSPLAFRPELCSAYPGVFPISFGSATSYTVGTNPVSVAVGDFNSDGFLDLTTANPNSNNISVLLGTGGGSFGPATNFTVGSAPNSIAVKDLNGDGKPDLVTANSDSSISVLLGQGGGSFGSTTNFTVGSGSSPFSSIAVEDFNGDKFFDLAIVNFFSNNVSILLGTGGGSFGAATNFSGGSGSVSVTVGDFNGDGKPDLVTANSKANTVSVLLGNGNGSFGSATNFSVGSLGIPRSIVVGDFNGDNKLDLATLNNQSTNNTVSVLLGTGTGSFGPPANFAVVGIGSISLPASMIAGDFNGDTKLDLATANTTSGSVSVLLRTGTGGFDPATGFSLGFNPVAVASGDFNSDGKPDLAAANGNSNSVFVALNTTSTTVTPPGPPAVTIVAGTRPTESGSSNGTFFIVLNNPAPAGGLKVNFNTTGSTATLNTDYIFDLANSTNITAIDPVNNTFTLAAGVTSATLAVKPVDDAVIESGGETVKVNLTLGTGYTLGSSNSAVAWFTPPINFSAGSAGAGPIAVGDFNKDGLLDLAAVTVNPPGPDNKVSIFLGKGGGSFSSPTAYTVGDVPNAIAVNDFNGDGKLDLATLNFLSNNISVLLGNGDGNFGKATNFSVGSSFNNSFTVGDFNGDGKPDIATSSGSILLGTGTGSFVSATNFGGSFPVSIASGDFNGDGKLDLVGGTIAGGGSYSVSVLLGNGGGSFGSTINFTVGDMPRAFAVKDFNQDGILDLAIANYFSDYISVLLGTGGGNFGSENKYFMGSRTNSISTGDFNGDGFLDLAAGMGDFGSNNISVLLGTGTGSFGSPTGLSVGSATVGSVAVGDFNDDGRPDLVTNGAVLLNSNQPSSSLPTASLKIVDNDPVSVQFSSATYQVNENGMVIGTAITVNRTGDTGSPGSVQVQLTNGTATGGTQPFNIGTDFNNGIQTINFGIGETSKTITIPVNDDNLMEGNENLTLSLVNPSANLFLGTQNTANLTLVDNDPVSVQFSQTSYQVDENGTVIGAGIRVNRIGDATNPANVKVQLTNGTATGGTQPFGVTTDFDNSIQTINFGSGETSKTLTIAIANDNFVEGNEDLSLALVDPSANLVLGSQNTATVTIVDNDFPVVTLTAAANPSESGSTNGTFALALDNPAPGGLTVNFNTIGSTANNPSDYIFDLAGSTNITAIGTNSFTVAPGVTSATLAVKPVDDAEIEPEGETIQVNLLLGTGYRLGSGSSAALLFNAANNFSTGVSPTSVVGNYNSVASGDFNQDGKPDLAVANTNSDNISILLGIGDGSFDTATIFTVGLSPVSVAVQDFNGDSKPDLAVVNANSDNISILLGIGDGSFGAASDFAVGIVPRSVTVKDFNSDGKIDLAVANSYSSNISVLPGMGEGSFGEATNFSAGSSSLPVSIISEDFNGDGILDLATANNSDVFLSSNNNISVLLGTGDGSFGQATHFTVEPGSSAIAVGDFNNDNKPDLMTANADSNNVSVLLGIGNGSFGSATSFAVGISPQSINVKDFDGDGKLDLAAAGSDNVSILLGMGDGSFSAASNFAAGSGTSAVVVEDFNSDGKPDLAAANSGSNDVSVLLNHPSTATLTIADNDSSIVTLPTVTLASGASPSESGITNGTFIITLDTPAPSEGLTINFNTIGSTANNSADYIFDLASSTNITAIGTNNFTIAPGVTSATLVLKPVDDAEIETGGETVQLNLESGVGYRLGYGNTAVAQFTPETNFNVGSFPTAVTAGDFNQDGFTDLVIANQFSDDLSIILGTGDGTFGSATNFSVGSFPIAVTSGDFNKDGFLDLAAVNEFSDDISVLFGIGDGSFGSATNFSVGFDPVSVAAKDINKDGFIDLIATNFGDNNVSVLLNAKDGSFGTATNFSVGSGPSSVTVNDFNQDGFLDLATTNFNTNDVSILLGTGDGNFGSAANFSVGLAPNSITVGDFNQDSFLDLATANQNSDNLSVLLGTGDGSFGTATNFAVEFGPGSVANSDFNGDGFLDLAATNLYSNNVSILLGLGDGNFGAATNLAVGSNPASIVVDDFNNDDKPDLATANQSSDSVSVLLNNNIPTASLTIADNDPVSVEFSAASYQVNEDGTIVGATVTINRIGDALSPASVQVQLTNGTATGGSQPFGTTTDFNNAIQTINFASGETSQIVTIPINNDNWVEGNENLTLTLINPSANLVLGTQTTANLTIVDNDVAEISINDVTVLEGNNGTTNAIFTVTLSNPSTQLVTVNYSTSDDSAAIADGDYTNIPATLLSFSPGETSKTITVAVNGDEKVEADETFNLNLSNATNATIVDNKGVAIITNDDVSPIVNNVTSTAPNGNYTIGQVIPITLTFSKNVFVTSTPQLTLETGTTDAVVNYTSGSGSNTLTFNYRVGLADTTADLDYISPNAFVLNGGTIKDAVGNDAVLDLPLPGSVGSLGANKAIAIPPLNNIIGTAGRDTLTGTSGSDRIIGEQVSDTLTGGLGNDEFVYNRIQDAGDFIMDFQVGSDRIVMTNLLASLGYSGANAIADGYVSFSARGSDAIVNLDPDGFAGTGRSRLYITVKNVSVTALNNTNNFVFI